MLRIADNVFSVLIDDNADRTADLPAVGTVVTADNLDAGAIVMVDAGMRRISATTPAGGGYDVVDRYRIVQGKGAGNELMMSPMITKATATLSTSAHRASAQQVSVVGYNGTSGSLPEADSTDYFIKIRKNDNDAANRSQPMSLFAGPIKSAASATQVGIAEALVSNGIVNFAKEPANNYLGFDLLTDSTAAANTGAGTVTATKGSKLVTFDTDVDAVAVVGDYIRFDESAGAAPATTDAVYKVVAMDTTNEIMTLDRPFSSASQAATAEGNAVIIAQGGLAAGDWGVRLTGIQADFDVNAMRDFYVNRFTVTFSDSSTLITTTGARTGSGVWQQVAMDEYMSYGFEGQNDMLGTPPRHRDQEVKIPGQGTITAADARYGCLEISWTENIQGLVSLQGGKGSVLVYINLDAATPGVQGTAPTSYELTNTILGLSATAFDEV